MIRCKKCQLAQCTCGAEDWEDYQTGEEAKTENASLRTQVEQLRQRVAELEKDCDEFEGNAAQWEQEYYKVSKERDKATQYWQIAEGRCDALIKKRDALLSALENCRLLAARHSKEEWATHILRFCVESGVIGSPIRDTDIASVKEK